MVRGVLLLLLLRACPFRSSLFAVLVSVARFPGPQLRISPFPLFLFSVSDPVALQRFVWSLFSFRAALFVPQRFRFSHRADRLGRPLFLTITFPVPGGSRMLSSILSHLGKIIIFFVFYVFVFGVFCPTHVRCFIPTLGRVELRVFCDAISYKVSGYYVIFVGALF